MTCDECKFFERVPDGLFPDGVAIGHCKRFPPVGKFKTTDGVANFATTRSDEWCGEFKAGEPGR